MNKKLLSCWLSIWLLLSNDVFAQHLGIAQLLEVYNATTDRRGVILKANDFDFRKNLNTPRTICYQYSRLQADMNNDEFEELLTYCDTGSLTYVTYSPDHATNLKFQLLRKFDFQDLGATTSAEGRLKNVYQRRSLQVETANTKNTQRQDMWIFQFHEAPTTTSPASPTAVIVNKEVADNDARTAGKISLKGNFYALIIGVNEYTDRRIADLTFPIQDATRLKHVLTDQYTFTNRTVTELSNPTRKAILRAFDDLNYKLKKEDNLLIFFAGHGRQDAKTQQGYWLPTDAQNDYQYDWLSNSAIRDQLRQFTCQHILVISDACFSGELISSRGAPQPSIAIKRLYEMRSRRAITSSGSTLVPDRSVFIDYLVQRLNENTKPYLTANELFVSMREAVINNSTLEQTPMYGYIQQSGDEGGDFIFVRRPH